MKPKEIEVGCAIIERKGKTLIAQRKPGSFLGGFWEFPGGKRHAEESIEDCVVREVYEELRIQVRVREFLRSDSYRYPEKIIHLFFYLCDWVSGEGVKEDVLDFRWVDPLELPQFRFPVGDDNMINELIIKRSVYFGPSVRNLFVLKEKEKFSS